jgi:hypothetical protein
VVEQWLLNVLLNHPQCVLFFLCHDEVNDVLLILKDFDTSALVLSRWLNNPHVFAAVFDWDTFMFASTTVLYFFKPV